MVGFFFSGPLMTIDTCSSPTDHGAESALQAITAESKAENAKQITALSVGTDGSHVTEHIQGMVAATMAHVSTDASTTTRANAEHWQQWALGVAKGV